MPSALNSGSFSNFVTNFVFYAVFSAIISTALAKIMFASSGLMLASTALSRIDLVIKAPTLKKCVNPKIPKDNGVVFKDVSFTYNGSSVPALSHISFIAKPAKQLRL